MNVRYGGYLLPSFLLHCAAFAALAVIPQPVESSFETEFIEYIEITETGGGQLGNDEQIGNAIEPTQPPEKKLRKVKPKPVQTAVVEEPKPKSEAGTASAIAATASSSLVSGSAGDDPNATAAGRGSGMTGIDRRSALRAWLREVQREVNKLASRNYPSSAVRMGLEGRLRLGLTIAADGKIRGVRVLTSSGHSVLDQSATESARAIDIPAPPPELHWSDREISLPIRYALR